ncbi:hypothetical protein PF005_g3621 [Phytophthora fragariae]|uniref:Uncharacterized protein n=1 Tax=Phytophthora fragariae TaxID=53985 RepID=A0A6A3FJF6_9STRA|nr:hypothetical protein PF003_g21492 [Phytophthora fragariae]KAE8944487.1 hypothetical protein PF009_g5848 [Phytophthora fragariae]KAE9010027.1 hypothetical protein PF011_g10004 [Phytophthora fragariae]KAE9132707.1 hypothetical protein PF007_g3628 [Phytophthora fragariae]KAE9152731.1 hypothetical protein PF006_g3076 [Phytophthora fragariae]
MPLLPPLLRVRCALRVVGSAGTVVANGAAGTTGPLVVSVAAVRSATVCPAVACPAASCPAAVCLAAARSASASAHRFAALVRGRVAITLGLVGLSVISGSQLPVISWLCRPALSLVLRPIAGNTAAGALDSASVTTLVLPGL